MKLQFWFIESLIWWKKFTFGDFKTYPKLAINIQLQRRLRDSVTAVLVNLSIRTVSSVIEGFRFRRWFFTTDLNTKCSGILKSNIQKAAKIFLTWLFFCFVFFHRGLFFTLLRTSVIVGYLHVKLFRQRPYWKSQLEEALGLLLKGRSVLFAPKSMDLQSQDTHTHPAVGVNNPVVYSAPFKYIQIQSKSGSGGKSF